VLKIVIIDEVIAKIKRRSFFASYGRYVGTRKALRLLLNFFVLFYSASALSGHGEAAHQIPDVRSLVKLDFFSLIYLATPPVIFRGGECEIWP